MQALTPTQIDTLARHAATAAAHAYAPYSRFFVGAAVLLDGGEMVTGVNVENASFRLTTCAEQTAIAAAVTRFGPAIRLRALAIHTRDAVACEPCGACRQTIAEFAPPEALIVFPGPGGARSTCTLADLLPASFRFVVSTVRP